jgi:hypothetical protein
MSGEKFSDNYKTEALSQDAVMPCLVYFRDEKNFEKIGVAEHFIDSQYVMVRYNSYCRDMKLYTDLKVCTLLNKA